MQQSFPETLRPLTDGGRVIGRFHALPALTELGECSVARLPYSLRIVLEAMLRHLDGERVTSEQVRELIAWQPNGERLSELPFMVARIIAPDASGIPLLADLAAMRDAALALTGDASAIEPVVPVDLVLDHSLQVDRAGSADALLFNMRAEFERNAERYAFVKWAAQAFDGIRVVPPGVGIIHQVNIEYVATGVRDKGRVVYPDTVVGPDSHTAMANGIGALAWGVGGIEAEAVMLGEPLYFQTPDVIGVELVGRLPAGVGATDLVLTLTQQLRQAGVVGAFVEFFGDGAAALPAADRCTVANMAPEYGATVGFFAVDDETLAYLRSTGRSEEAIAAVRAYWIAQQMFGMPAADAIDYTRLLRIDLRSIEQSVAGPRRPQDRLALGQLAPDFERLLALPREQGGFGRPPREPRRHASAAMNKKLRDGDILIAAITSCANTSNPALLVAAGLLARNAVRRGLRTPPHVKTSFTPGSRAVESYLRETGLQTDLDRLGFQIVGFGCGTCMGNSGPLDAALEQVVDEQQLVVVSVLSGNRNFEARIHPAIRANYLMSPALVVACAIAGRIDLDLATEPLGVDADGLPVYLCELWPSDDEVAALRAVVSDPTHFKRAYDNQAHGNPRWEALPAPSGRTYPWDAHSTYLRRPPFFDGVTLRAPTARDIRGARALVILGDSVTTDHVSPGGSIGAESPAGLYLQSQGVAPRDFNTYVARRVNHEVMLRGSFANVRLRNRMLPGIEGGWTAHQPDGERMPVSDAALAYANEQVPLIVLAGLEYGTGSSRDWAAKGPQLLGVRAVIARSFERIHRSNLVGMGILPCQFASGESAETLALDGSETFDVEGIESGVAPGQALTLRCTRRDGSVVSATVTARVDTSIEATYLRHGGILPHVLRRLLAPHHESRP